LGCGVNEDSCRKVAAYLGRKVAVGKRKRKPKELETKGGSNGKRKRDIGMGNKKRTL